MTVQEVWGVCIPSGDVVTLAHREVPLPRARL